MVARTPSTRGLLVLRVLGCLGSHDNWLLRPYVQKTSRCVYVDLGAHNGDSFDYFVTGTTFEKHNPRKAKYCLDPVHCADFGMLWTLPEMGCPKVPNRTNIEYYGVEANPEHDAALRRRFELFPNTVRGMFTQTAIWNETSTAQGLEFFPNSFFADGPHSSDASAATASFRYSKSKNDMTFAFLSAGMAAKVRRAGFKPIIVHPLDVCELILNILALTPADKVAVKLDVEDVAEAVVMERLLARPDCLAVIKSIAFEGGGYRAGMYRHRPPKNSNFVLRFQEVAPHVTVRPWA